MDLYEVGKVYNRLNDIHLIHGGNRRSGIASVTKSPYVFIFTGMQGHQYGYSDGFVNGVFEYTGEGQTGDMIFTGGNKAIRDHVANGKALLVFSSIPKAKGYSFMGNFICGGYSYRQLPDKLGALRQAIVFHLMSSDALKHTNSDETSYVSTQDKTLKELRKTAYSAVKAVEETEVGESTRKVYQRSSQIKDYVLKRAQGLCECCGQPAPFTRKNGSPYLEPHHLLQLSDDGLDHPRWIAALTPNCHRRIHYSAEGKALNDALKDVIGAKESSFD